MKTCAYCQGDMDATGLPADAHSHGLCAACSVELEAAAESGAPQIGKCASCMKDIGGWRSLCVPCEVARV